MKKFKSAVEYSAALAFIGALGAGVARAHDVYTAYTSEEASEIDFLPARTKSIERFGRNQSLNIEIPVASVPVSSGDQTIYMRDVYVLEMSALDKWSEDKFNQGLSRASYYSASSKGDSQRQLYAAVLNELYQFSGMNLFSPSQQLDLETSPALNLAGKMYNERDGYGVYSGGMETTCNSQDNARFCQYIMPGYIILNLEASVRETLADLTGVPLDMLKTDMPFAKNVMDYFTYQSGLARLAGADPVQADRMAAIYLLQRYNDTDEEKRMSYAFLKFMSDLRSASLTHSDQYAGSSYEIEKILNTAIIDPERIYDLSAENIARQVHVPVNSQEAAADRALHMRIQDIVPEKQRNNVITALNKAASAEKTQIKGQRLASLLRSSDQDNAYALWADRQIEWIKSRDMLESLEKDKIPTPRIKPENKTEPARPLVFV